MDGPLDRACIHHLIEAAAARTPEAIAVEHGGERLTYAELNGRANRLARALCDRGVGPETRVGICLDRSIELMVGLLGVLKAGGAYLPLDPSYPRERLAYALEDAQAPLLVTRSALLDRLPAGGAEVVALDEAASHAAIAAQSENQPDAQVGPANTAYVIYTSGSTGRPKGVLVPHGAVANHARAMVEQFELRAADRVLQFAAIGFDVALEELFPTWLAGATVVLRPEEVATSPAELQRFAARTGLTVLNLPTPFWHAWVEELERSGDELPSALRLVVVGSDRALPEYLARWTRLVGERVRWLNAYGPTEATVTTTVYEPAPDAIERPDRAVAIGHPIHGARCYVLDPGLRPVGDGEVGELYIGGAGLARGYLDRPTATAEQFVPDPFAEEPGARLYRTGDLARFREDGNLEFLGRADDQVKVRGFRIEPGEVEVALAQHPAVRESAVVAREEPGGERRLVAYLVLRTGCAPTARWLRAFLKEHLPPYMVPSMFVRLEALPLAPSGKLDRRALPAPESASILADDEDVGPRTAAEAALASILADVLGVERVGVQASFFDLGGHSLLATRLAARVREALGVELAVREVFDAPSVAALAERIEALRTSGQQTSVGPISRADRSKPLPLSFSQERLWFLDQLEPGSTLYNLPFAARLSGRLDLAALEQSLGEIVRRHEALRTTFAERDGRSVQVIGPATGTGLATIDLSGLPAAEREAAAERLAREEAARPFDLARGSLLRTTLARLTDDDHLLLLAMHHIVSDGWSMEVLFRELATLYQDFAAGRGASLPELPIQYADYAVWQREWLDGDRLQAQLDYWREQLAHAPAVLELPTDRPHPSRQTFRGAVHDFDLPLELGERVATIAAAERATPYMALLGAFAMLLQRYTGQVDLVIGSPIAGRRRAEAEGLIGFFVNTLALRLDLSGDPTFRELLGRVREVVLGADAHQDLPFERLVEALQPRRDPSRGPLVQVVFAYLQTGLDPIELPGLTLRPRELHNGTAKFELTLFLERTARGLAGRIEYNADLFQSSTIARLAGHLQVLLEEVVADPDSHISALSLLTAAELAQLDAWNETAAELPTARCAHELVEAVAEQHPDALAVASRTEYLSYGELNRRANRLARYLRALGVGPEDRVGICLERSTDLVVAQLATLKAGGAYVPLDPAYPADRLVYMLEDAGAAALITRVGLAAGLPSAQVPTILVDDDRAAIEREDDLDLPSGVGPSGLAYVIYTSGSTGWPKGTQIEHRGLLNLIGWHQRSFAIMPADRASLLAGPAFDASVWELWPYLTIGAAVHIPDDETRGEPTRLRDWLVEQAITVSFLPTPLAEAVLDLDWPSDVALRILLTGGDMLHRSPRSDPPFALVNNYGPTESTVVTTSAVVSPRAEPDGTPPPIGRPIDNTKTYVLDRYLQRVPVGVPGELYIGSVALSRGYRDRPDLTAERFIPNPFEDEPGARLYQTGDLVRYREDGSIEFLGRLDHQVKLRGFRIELGEIETVLAQHPSVRECLVMVREDDPGDKRLVAYVAPQDLAIADLRAHLAERVPDYMVPSAFVALERLPQTPNGKLDRRALPAPTPTETDEEFIAPQGEVEQAVAAIWAEILGLERVSAGHDFFQLGGHSLLATRVIARLRESLKVDLPLRSLFEAPTLSRFAQAVGAARQAKPAVAAPSIGTVSRAAYRVKLQAR